MTDAQNSTGLSIFSPPEGAPALFSYTLHLADTALILGQRNSEWCGHGPVLEQDIAITNISLDLLGQSRNFYQYAAALYNDFSTQEKEQVNHYIPRLWKAYNREINEDDLAFLRDENQYLNLLLTELPKGDWAQTILRELFISAFQFYQYSQLQNISDAALAAIAEKSIKEVTYHVRWSSEWVIRLGDGTAESNRRLQQALTELWPYTGELFIPASYEMQLIKKGFGTDVRSIKNNWLKKVEAVFTEATLSFPSGGGREGASWYQQGGKEGQHTEYMGYLLAEMQYLQKTFPNVVW